MSDDMTREERIARAAEMAADWWAERLMQGDRAKFRESLRASVQRELTRHARLTLMCDYDPWDELLDAVHAAGVGCRGCFFSADGILPSKHSLYVTPDELEPKEGYGNFVAKIPVVGS